MPGSSRWGLQVGRYSASAYDAPARMSLEKARNYRHGAKYADDDECHDAQSVILRSPPIPTLMRVQNASAGFSRELVHAP